MIRILVDSSSDYTLEEIREKNIDFVPITVTIGSKSYQDVVELKPDDFYEMLITGNEFPKTAQPSPQDFAEVFKDAKEKGDDIICILLSSALSGTCQSAAIAKDMVDYDNIYIIDSLTATIMIKIFKNYLHRIEYPSQRKHSE